MGQAIDKPGLFLSVEGSEMGFKSLLLIGLVLFLVFCAVVTFALTSSDMALYLGPRIDGAVLERLAQLGDSFAPLTSLFALLATVAAAASFLAQSKALQDERAWTRQQRFDEMVFKLIDRYERLRERRFQLNRMGESVPLVDALHTFLKECSCPHPRQHGPRSWLSAYQDLKRSRVYSHPDIPPFGRAICSIVETLSWSSADAERMPHLKLLVSSLGRDEVLFWHVAVEMFGTDVTRAAYSGSGLEALINAEAGLRGHFTPLTDVGYRWGEGPATN